MKTILLGLLTALLPTMGIPKGTKLPDTHPVIVRAAEAALDVAALFEDKDISARIAPAEREAWARMVYVYHAKEASFFADPKGYADDGNACGALQLWKQYFPKGITCEAAKKSRYLGLKAGLTVALDFRDKCGNHTIGEAWSAYGPGFCPPKGIVFLTASQRCKIAGVTC